MPPISHESYVQAQERVGLTPPDPNMLPAWRANHEARQKGVHLPYMIVDGKVYPSGTSLDAVKADLAKTALKQTSE